MNSMQDLNGFGNTAIIYTDDRSPLVTFSGSGNAVIFANVSASATSYSMPAQRSIVSARSILANSTFTISNVTATGNIAWTSPLPSGIASSKPVSTSYRLTGPLFPSTFDLVKTPTLNLPANFSTGFTMTSNIALGNTANTQSTFTTQVVYPFTGQEWSWANGASLNNSADNFTATCAVAGSVVDLYTSNVQVNLGNVGCSTVTSQSISVNGSTGNAVVTVNGRFDNPISGFTPDIMSTANTTITLNTASGRVVSGPAALRVSVDGINNIGSVGGPFRGATRSQRTYQVEVVSSGIASQWPVELTISWPEITGSGQFWQVWLVLNNTIYTDAQWNAVPILSGTELTAAGRIWILNNNEIVKTRTITINTGWANHASFTWPSTVLSRPLGLTLQQGGGFSWPTTTPTFTITKTAVNANNGNRSRTIFPAF
jgi:hypothetical protein